MITTGTETVCLEYGVFDMDYNPLYFTDKLFPANT